jgi:hypothetical protein
MLKRRRARANTAALHKPVDSDLNALTLPENATNPLQCSPFSKQTHDGSPAGFC